LITDEAPGWWFDPFHGADDTRRHRQAHLHLMKPGELRWHDQLSFRARLRTEPALLDEYAALKTRAAAEHPDDREAYSQAKAKFIRRVFT
jgi:GrpB-like predicted nucleotidyltransferase (UPF0157 family)